MLFVCLFVLFGSLVKLFACFLVCRWLVGSLVVVVVAVVVFTLLLLRLLLVCVTVLAMFECHYCLEVLGLDYAQVLLCQYMGSRFELQTDYQQLAGSLEKHETFVGSRSNCQMPEVQ